MSKKIPLTIYLSKPDIDISNCFDFTGIEKKPDKFNLTIESFEESLGYIDVSHPKAPPWLEFFTKVTDVEDKTRLNSIVRKTQSLSAIVAIKHPPSNRYFILCFGYGRKFLNDDCYERFFGRNLVLNTADESKIIALRTRSYEGVPWYKEYQSFLSNKLADFDFNCDYEHLQKITANYQGKIPAEFLVEVSSKNDPSKKSFKSLISFKIAGQESVKINANITEINLELLFNWLEENFNKMRYKQLVRNIESFQPMKDSTEISALNDHLFDELYSKNYDNLYLVIPEKIDPENLSSFAISGTQFEGENRLDELDLVTIFDDLSDSGFMESATFEELKSIRVMAFNGDQHQHTWSLARCLFGEVEYFDEKFTLIDGQWFSVEAEFYNQMRTKVTSSISANTKFDAFDKKVHRDEANYNIAMAKKNNFLLFDRNLIQPSVKGEIEACDLLDSTNLIHVKRYRSSACLSHLFFQSYVSHQLILEDKTFLNNFSNEIERMNSKILPIFKKSITNRDHSVSLVIIFENKDHKKWTPSVDSLPVFSLITICKTIDALKSKGNLIKVNVHLIGAVK